MQIAKSIVDLIGNTPLLELCRYNKANEVKARIIAKVESFNPLSSVKDRVAYALIKNAEDKGLVNKDTVIIEPTSGNTGIGLAGVCAARGYRLIIIMPETMSIERRMLIEALGAEVVLTEGEKGMAGAIERAEKLAASMPNSFIPGQFTNRANPECHKKTTAEEIWKDTDGKIDIFVAGVGTGGTITGIGEFLKRKSADIKIVAVEPYDSAVISGRCAGTHNIQGIGAGFVPEILNVGVIDEVISVKNEEAFETSRMLARLEGIPAGISSGASLFAATVIANREENKDKNIVVLLPDTGERYLSAKLFD